MIKHGTAPFLECSSKGDKRFSAFYAKVNDKSIEEQFQSAKIVVNKAFVHWRDKKGLHAINQDEVVKLYSQLWDQYIAENPDLLQVLKQATGLSDIFGQSGHVCQASELWRIRNA